MRGWPQLGGSRELTCLLVQVDARTELVIAADIAERLHISRARISAMIDATGLAWTVEQHPVEAVLAQDTGGPSRGPCPGSWRTSAATRAPCQEPPEAACRLRAAEEGLPLRAATHDPSARRSRFGSDLGRVGSQNQRHTGLRRRGDERHEVGALAEPNRERSDREDHVVSTHTLNAQPNPFEFVSKAHKAALSRSQKQLVAVYGNADDALKRFGTTFDQSDLRRAAEVLCKGMAGLSSADHPLWIVLKEYPSVLNPDPNVVTQMLNDLRSFAAKEAAILRAAGMKPKAAKAIASDIADAFSKLDPTSVTVPVSTRVAQVDDLVRTASNLNRSVCAAAEMLKKDGWQMPSKQPGLFGFAQRVAKSKWFLGGATAAGADLLSGGVPILGWFAAAIASPLAVTCYLGQT